MTTHRTLLLLLAVAASAAQAHVALDDQVARAGSSYRATFQVGHGCGAAPTRQLSIAIPPGVADARPMPKPGWSLEIQREKLAQPLVRDGRTVADRVARITWTAKTAADRLSGEQYDEFVLAARLPAEPGTLYWPVSQACEPGRIDWVEVTRAGQSPHELKNPAPALEVLPAAGEAHHH
ncbi:MAG: YcnI family copper-binding membrane protein [Ramlibacter sp.]